MKEIRKFLTYNADEAILLLFGLATVAGVFTGHVTPKAWQAFVLLVLGHYFGKKSEKDNS